MKYEEKGEINLLLCIHIFIVFFVNLFIVLTF